MEVVQETIIRDIIDIINDAKDIDSLDIYLNRKNTMVSLARNTANLTAVFPVFCSTNINIQNASMVSKAIERKSATMLQLLLAANQMTNYTNATEYLKQFHNNLKINDRVTVDSALDAVDKIIGQMESVDMIGNVSDSIIPFKEAQELIKKDMKNINNILPESISDNSLNSFMIKNNSVYFIKEDKEYDDAFMRQQNMLKNNLDITLKQRQLNNIDDEIIRNQNMEKNKLDIQLKKNQAAGKSKDEVIRNQNMLKNNLDIQLKNNQLNKNSDNMSEKDRMTMNLQAIPKLVESDIKKANELVPSIMQISIYNTSKDGVIIPMTFLIGVKAKLYSVNSNDIVTKIISKNKDTNFFLKFIRATTREISFFRDFVFAVDKAKLDALSQSRKGSSNKIWKILERRAKMSKLKRWISKSNDAMAISSLVVSQEDVEYIKAIEKVDIENPVVIRPIMEAYNLMHFIIVDELTETCKFISDTGDDVYETISFTHLERESGDGAYKKVINLMSKISR